MGQQQLLLVILVTIIVGIATVVAINTFSSAADAANLDAVRNDLATIGSSAQGYYMKPDMLGGGGRTFSDIEFSDIAFPANGVTSTGKEAQNENGAYKIAPDAQEIVITASPSSDPDYVPGTVTDGVLSTGTVASETIEARVCPDDVKIGAPGESADACD